MQSGIDQLRDIQGITGVPWWPLAPGWWMLLGGILTVGFLAYRWRTILRLRVPIPGLTLGTWRWDAAAELRELRRRARAGEDVKTTLSELSELLRRIAMARLGRDACAGLTGEAWLGWLADNDPKGFPWREKGKPLLDIPYAPAGRAAGRDIEALIEAAYGWVAAPRPKPKGAASPPEVDSKGLLRSVLLWRRRGATRPTLGDRAGANGEAPGIAPFDGHADRSAPARQSESDTALANGSATAHPEPGRV